MEGIHAADMSKCANLCDWIWGNFFSLFSLHSFRWPTGDDFFSCLPYICMSSFCTSMNLLFALVQNSVYTVVEQFASVLPGLLHAQYSYFPAIHHISQVSPFKCKDCDWYSPYSYFHTPAFPSLLLPPNMPSPSILPLFLANSSTVFTGIALANSTGGGCC